MKEESIRPEKENLEMEGEKLELQEKTTLSDLRGSVRHEVALSKHEVRILNFYL